MWCQWRRYTGNKSWGSALPSRLVSGHRIPLLYNGMVVGAPRQQTCPDLSLGLGGVWNYRELGSGSQAGGVWGITLIVQSLHLADSLGAGRSPEQTLRAQPCRKKRLDISVPRTLACLRFCESLVCGINLPRPRVRLFQSPDVPPKGPLSLRERSAETHKPELQSPLPPSSL